MSQEVDRITHQGQELAVVVRAAFSRDGIAFFTPGDYSQQLGYMNRPAGYQVQPHRHNEIEREVRKTLETLFVRHGKMRIDFFDDAGQVVADVVVATGDVVLLVAGAHGMTMLEPSEIIEVKQGPYAGDQDKTLL
jgi:hypothetical protein